METKNTENHWSNWAGNYTCQPESYLEPSSEAELISIVQQAKLEHKKIRVHGAGHSFSPIAVSDEILISMAAFNKVLAIDKVQNTVTCQAGLPLKELYAYLAKEGLSLSNFGVINKQTVSGAIATGTHGSGLNHSSISSAVLKLRIITGKGEILDIEKGELLDAMQVSLGLLGIVVAITLQCEPLFYLKSEEYILDFDACLLQMDRLAKANEYLKIWWFPHTNKVTVFKINRASPQEIAEKESLEQYTGIQRKRDAWIDVFTAPMFQASLEDPSLIPSINQYCLDTFFTPKVRIGTSFEILVHDETVPMIVSEYALPFELLEGAEKVYIKALKSFRELLIKENLYLHFPVDLRFAASENAWLSTAYQQSSFYIGICVREYSNPTVPETMRSFFDLMHQYPARPHWGKLFDPAIDVQACFPKLADFLALKKRLDPATLFSNKYLADLLI